MFKDFSRNSLFGAFLSLFALPLVGYANNIQVGNLRITGQDTSAGANNPVNFTMVEFDVDWENSWRTSSGPSNWDAAWVFVKFRVGVNDPILTGANSSGTTVTVTSTAGLRVGMPIVVTSGTGAFAANTVINSIANDTQFVVSVNPSVPLSNATVTCRRIWEHASLDATSGNHFSPIGSTVEVTTDSTGVFIFRSSNGTGNLNLTDVQLRWNYGVNGVFDDAPIQLKVFAIEMVYVPGGVDFNVGGGGGGNAFASTTINTAVANALPTGMGSLGGQAGGYPTGETAPNAIWPNGYNAFYCMKYEISQGQYRDFLNTLTYEQQTIRTGTAPSNPAGTGALSNTNRNGMDIEIPGNATSFLPAVYACNLNNLAPFNHTDDGEWIACNRLNWMDGCAFADWAGLRPMTELEFEKACRGDQVPVANEYAWGTNSLASGSYTLFNAGAANEGIATNYSTTNGNASYATTDGSINGPLRVGIFAANGSNSGRISAGAAYYGIMDMSGNLIERCVTIGNMEGRTFSGIHGDGKLNARGNATENHWPGLSTNGVDGATGSGFRGTSWLNSAAFALVSDRTNADITIVGRGSNTGFRAVRSAP